MVALPIAVISFPLKIRILIYEIGNLFPDFFNLLIQICDMFFDQKNDRFMCRADPILLLTSHVDQAINPPDQSSQGSDLRRRGTPGTWFHSQTESCNQGGIKFIRLGANQFTLSKSLDAGGIDNADNVASIMKIDRQVLSIIARSLHTSMHFLSFLFLKPEPQYLKTFCRILADLMFCLPVYKKCGIELLFRNVYPKNPY